MDDDAYLRTSLGQALPDRITLKGRDLPSELMGRLTLTELTFLMLTDREPTDGERRVLDTVLVSLADHGHTPSSLATRLTYTGAPEALQGAVAAGLLGAGSVFLGPAGDTAQFLVGAVAEWGLGSMSDDDRLAEVAAELVDRCRREQRRVPGLGHPVHRDGDPRTPRIYEVAAEEGLLGVHLRLLESVADAHVATGGRRLPINGAGAGGAALVDVGLPADLVRGVVLVARTAGLVAHLAEEMRAPIGMPLWREVESRAAGEP